MTSLPARAKRLACERPRTATKLSRPRTIASSGLPAASAAALAANALRTLCVPPRRSEKLAAPAGVCIATTQWSPCQTALPETSAGTWSAKVIVRRAPAISRQMAAWAASAGKTATPSSPRAAIAAPFWRATASTVAMNSRCSRCALLTSAIVGAAALAQAQQRQRQADVVVEVAFGGERRIADPGAEDRRDHLRHRGLAVA